MSEKTEATTESSASNFTRKIVGERVYLAPITASEEEIVKFTNWMNDFAISDYIITSSAIYTALGEKDYLESAARDHNNRSFNIVAVEKDRLIGSITLKDINWVNRSAVLGIFIGDADFRAHGYGTEAVNLILEYGFRHLNLHSVQLEVLANNERAHRCYQKCGFQDTGKLREHVFVAGKYCDVLEMDILEDEFAGKFIKNRNL